jgi:hypothetical protein
MTKAGPEAVDECTEESKCQIENRLVVEIVWSIASRVQVRLDNNRQEPGVVCWM